MLTTFMTAFNREEINMKNSVIDRTLLPKYLGKNRIKM